LEEKKKEKEMEEKAEDEEASSSSSCSYFRFVQFGTRRSNISAFLCSRK
jgi:hypothetical protein